MDRLGLFHHIAGDSTSRDGDAGVGAPSDCDPRLKTWLMRFSRLSGVLVALIGVLVLIGWATGLTVLKSISNVIVAVNPLTAVCFILAGSSLRLWWLGRTRPGAKPLARGLALAVVALGLLKLVDLFPGWDVGVDRWLFADSLEVAWEAQANRMAPNTAVGMLLIGLGLAVADVETHRRDRPSQPFAIAVALVALLALIGYSYGVVPLYGLARFIPMALTTALALVLLALGLLCLWPDRGMMMLVTSKSEAGMIIRRLLPTSVILPMALGWLCLRGVRDNLYTHDLAASMMVVSNVILFLILIWWSARLLHRAEVQRRRADEARAASESFYHVLVESLPQNILRKDLEGRFTFVNQRFCETIGRRLDEVLGHTDLDFFPTELAQKYRADDADVMQSGQNVDVVEEHVTPDGETHYVQVIKTPLYGASGKAIGVQGIFWDVTASRRAEQKLRAQNALLQKLAASERQALDDLKGAQVLMVETAKLAGLGQMVAGVAHEINNPLSYVSNNVAVLQRDLGEIAELIELYRQGNDLLRDNRHDLYVQITDLSERVDIDYTLMNLCGLLNRTRDGLNRIQQIVKDLRIFARLDESDLNETDLNAGVESTATIILGNAKKKGIKIELDLSPLPPVVCFPAKINQVIMNLVSNAIDA
ncbi:MAG: PAS domain-containing protein, partial [Isosphaeraceae bacterium]